MLENEQGDDGGEGGEVSMGGHVRIQQLIKLQRQVFMITSKSIKLLITNNQSHLQFSKRDVLPATHVECQECQIEDLQLDQEYGSEQRMCQRDMFTIREEESYQYESDAESVCGHKNNIQSCIDTLSTIRATNKQMSSTVRLLKGLDSHGLLRDRNNQNITMCSINGTKSHQLAFPQVQSWEQKIKQNVNQEEVVGDQQIIVLKSSQKALKLDKMRISKSSALFKTYLKTHFKTENVKTVQLICCDSIGLNSTLFSEDIEVVSSKNKMKKKGMARINSVKADMNKRYNISQIR